MSASMQALHQLADFASLTLHLSNQPIVGIFLGTIFTLLVQSSTATVGVLQGLYAEQLIGLNSALPILFGENIGTTITAVLASLGASIYAKRAAGSSCII